RRLARGALVHARRARRPADASRGSRRPSERIARMTISIVGAVLALTSSSISVQIAPGKPPLTCSIGVGTNAMVSAQRVAVGSRVQIACADGVLVKVAVVPPPAPTQSAQGIVTALGSASITAG